MTDTVSSLRERSKKRRELLAKQLGARCPEDLTAILGNKDAAKLSLEQKSSRNAKSSRNQEPEAFIVAKTDVDEDKNAKGKRSKIASKDADDEVEIEDYFKVLQKEEEYKGSHTFLKGTQSANPHNDYSQHFVDTGQRPQNFIRDSGLAERFEEYPKLKELIYLKDQLVQSTAMPPMYLKCDPSEMDLAELGCKFDVIIVEPPLEEYQRRGVLNKQSWTWEMIEQLNIPAVADWRCFIWLWCGSSDGLSWGRRCLKSWGFRRCEDICWIKTNKNGQREHIVDPGSLFQRTKEHCLMGIKGTVRRSVDGDFIHANVDIDLIISEEPAYGSTQKPEEIYLIAEHFCLGRRRLHVFGTDDSIRQGWLTVGPDLTSSNFDPQLYRAYFEKEPGQTTGCTKEIEMLRPKSPTQNRGMSSMNPSGSDAEPPPPGFSNPPPPGTSSAMGHIPRPANRPRAGSRSANNFSFARKDRKDNWPGRRHQQRR